MPSATAGLSDVVARNPHPLELGRIGEHRTQKLAVTGLELGALIEPQPRLSDPSREFIAHPLQLAQAEHPRLARDAAELGADLHPAKGVGEKAGQLPLEPANLAPQLGARQALIGRFEPQPECLFRAGAA